VKSKKTSIILKFLSGKGPMRIVITGAKHSGKTTIAQRLAAVWSIPALDTDSELERLYALRTGTAETTRGIYAALGETSFRELERESARAALSSDWCIISTGGGVVLDPSIREFLYAGSVIVHLSAAENLLWKRIETNGIPSFYQGPDGREKHRTRVSLIDEIMSSRADINFRIDESNQESAAEEIAILVENHLGLRMGSPSSFGEIVRTVTFGESHGKALGAVLDGLAPGVELTEDDIQKELDRRRPGQSAVATPRNEKDRVRILSGVFEGRTTGTPVCMVVFNEDQDSTKYDALRDVFRPGHADFTFWKKYGVRDHRGGGRSSGRETIGRVCAGAAASKILASRGVCITAFAEEIAGIKSGVEDFSVIEKNSVRAADLEAAALMEKAILDAREMHDSVGGIVKLVIRGVPAGLGDPVFFKLDARLAQAFVSLGAVKGVEFGAGFSSARLRGSRNNDPVSAQGFESNNAGGILGGISNGDEIIVRIAVKPTPSIFMPQKTTDTSGNECEVEIKGRHDPCIVPRIISVVESMAALVLLDAWEINSRIAGVSEK
jgi:chorismate synthase